MIQIDRRLVFGLVLALTYAALSYALLGAAFRIAAPTDHDAVLYSVAGPISFLLPVHSFGVLDRSPFVISYAVATVALAIALWLLFWKLQRPSLAARAAMGLLGWLVLGFIGFVLTSNA